MNLEIYNRVIAVGVDIQNDFIPDGSLAVVGGDEVVKPFNSLTDWVRNNAGLVVFTRDWHPKDTNHFGSPPNLISTWPVHCVANTSGAKFHPDLKIYQEDTILSKGTKKDENAYSGFQGKANDGLTLEQILYPEKHDKIAVFIGGIATDYCVKATVLDTLLYADKFVSDTDRKIGVFVLGDAIRPVSLETGAVALEEMKAAGAKIVTSDQVVSNSVVDVRKFQWNQ